MMHARIDKKESSTCTMQSSPVHTTPSHPATEQSNPVNTATSTEQENPANTDTSAEQANPANTDTSTAQANLANTEQAHSANTEQPKPARKNKAPTKPRVSLTLEDKYTIIKNGFNLKQAKAAYGIADSTFFRIKRHSASIKDGIQNIAVFQNAAMTGNQQNLPSCSHDEATRSASTSIDCTTDKYFIPTSHFKANCKGKKYVEKRAKTAATRKRFRSRKYIEVEKVLLTWMKNQRQYSSSISNESLKSAALKIANNIFQDKQRSSQFTASLSWIRDFKSRVGIYPTKSSGESASASLKDIPNFKKELFQLIQTKGYTNNDIYNADESGLYYRTMPRRSLALIGEKASGHKASKERITVLVTANANGHKLPPCFVGKARKPRALAQHIKNDTLPFSYYSAAKGWMTKSIFKLWYENDFVPAVVEHQLSLGKNIKDIKILLLLDNASSHPGELQYVMHNGLPRDAIQILFLPPNTTSVIQPMDQNVIQTAKMKYRRMMQLSCMQVSMTEEDHSNDQRGFRTLQAFKQWNLLDAMTTWKNAWSTVTENNIKTSFKNLLSSQKFNTDESCHQQISVMEEAYNNLLEEEIEWARTYYDASKLQSTSQFDEEGIRNFLQSDKHLDGVDIHPTETPLTEVIEDYILNEDKYKHVMEIQDSFNDSISDCEDSDTGSTCTSYVSLLQDNNMSYIIKSMQVVENYLKKKSLVSDGISHHKLSNLHQSLCDIRLSLQLDMHPTIHKPTYKLPHPPTHRSTYNTNNTLTVLPSTSKTPEQPASKSELYKPYQLPDSRKRQRLHVDVPNAPSNTFLTSTPKSPEASPSKTQISSIESKLDSIRSNIIILSETLTNHIHDTDSQCSGQVKAPSQKRKRVPSESSNLSEYGLTQHSPHFSGKSTRTSYRTSTVDTIISASNSQSGKRSTSKRLEYKYPGTSTCTIPINNVTSSRSARMVKTGQLNMIISQNEQNPT